MKIGITMAVFMTQITLLSLEPTRRLAIACHNQASLTSAKREREREREMHLLIYLRIHTYTHIYIYMHIHIYTSTHIHMYTDTHVHTICIYVSTYMHLYIYIYMYIYICICICQRRTGCTPFCGVLELTPTQLQSLEHPWLPTQIIRLT